MVFVSVINSSSFTQTQTHPHKRTRLDSRGCSCYTGSLFGVGLNQSGPDQCQLQDTDRQVHQTDSHQILHSGLERAASQSYTFLLTALGGVSGMSLLMSATILKTVPLCVMVCARLSRSEQWHSRNWNLVWTSCTHANIKQLPAKYITYTDIQISNGGIYLSLCNI